MFQSPKIRRENLILSSKDSHSERTDPLNAGEWLLTQARGRGCQGRLLGGGSTHAERERNAGNELWEERLCPPCFPLRARPLPRNWPMM